MDQIIIRDLLVHGVIGVYEQERAAPQDILINIVLFVDLSLAGQSDDLADTANYAQIVGQVKQHAETSRRFTVEALATDLADLCLAFQLIQRVRIRVEKPGILPFCASVGVEIERSREL